MSTYSAARRAQLAYVQAVGIELAMQNIQVNTIAQNFVDNPTCFPAELQANSKFQDRLAREVPLGRLVAAREDAIRVVCSLLTKKLLHDILPAGYKAPNKLQPQQIDTAAALDIL